MPYSAPKPCKHTGCKEVTHNKDSYCEHHTPTHTHKWESDKVRGTATERGYGYRWQKLRKVILRRDSYLCQPCEREGKATPAQAVDHIRPKSQGGTDDYENLQSICSVCHNIKTQKEGDYAKTT